jgi:arylsulfatase A-like enzyme
MAASRPSRSNFLLFITDQHRADFLGCYGHPVLRTPHIDSIAARGMAFDRFYVASPVCMPNRASLMTGRMPSVHGVRSNGIPLSMNSVTFVELLRDAGYRTALIGKSHLQNFTSWPPLVQRTPAREGYREPQRPRRPELRAGDARVLDCEGRSDSNAVLRLRSRHPGACAR